jgi:hypothetical protein
VDPERRKGRDMQRAIGDILLRNWDPIGIADVAEAHDEYDAYVGGVYRLLASGASPKQIAEHLARVETSTLGFADTDPKTLVPVGKKLINAYRRLTEPAAAEGSGHDSILE